MISGWDIDRLIHRVQQTQIVDATHMQKAYKNNYSEVTNYSVLPWLWPTTYIELESLPKLYF